MSAADPIPVVAPDALSGRVVLVAGANGGLGEATAKACAAAGATMVLLGRRVPKLNRLYDAVAALGPEPAIYPLDLEGAGPNDYAELADKLAAELGRLDGIVHAAADFKALTPLELTAPEDFARALHVNLLAPWLLTQACLPLLKQAADSAVVFVAEDPERVSRAYWGGYGVAKHGLAGLVPMLAAELENSTVRVSALQPEPMRTPLRARAYFGEDPGQWPEAAAYAPAVVHLLSPAGAAQRGSIWKVRA